MTDHSQIMGGTLPVYCNHSPWITQIWNRMKSKIDKIAGKFPTVRAKKRGGINWIRNPLSNIIFPPHKPNYMKRFNIKILKLSNVRFPIWCDSSLRNNDCEEDDHSAKTLLKILIPIPVSSDVITWDSSQNPSQLHWITLSHGSGPETGSPWQSLKGQWPHLIMSIHLVQ